MTTTLGSLPALHSTGPAPASSASHTPGPWSVKEAYWPGIEADDGGEGTTVVCFSNDEGAVEAGIGGYGAKERLANARLIAAAPRMRAYIERQAASGDAEAASILEAIQ